MRHSEFWWQNIKKKWPLHIAWVIERCSKIFSKYLWPLCCRVASALRLRSAQPCTLNWVAVAAVVVVVAIAAAACNLSCIRKGQCHRHCRLCLKYIKTRFLSVSASTASSSLSSSSWPLLAGLEGQELSPGMGKGKGKGTGYGIRSWVRNRGRRWASFRAYLLLILALRFKLQGTQTLQHTHTHAHNAAVRQLYIV